MFITKKRLPLLCIKKKASEDLSKRACPRNFTEYRINNESIINRVMKFFRNGKARDNKKKKKKIKP